jgi:hypothetical protein
VSAKRSEVGGARGHIPDHRSPGSTGWSCTRFRSWNGSWRSGLSRGVNGAELSRRGFRIHLSALH